MPGATCREDDVVEDIRGLDTLGAAVREVGTFVTGLRVSVVIDGGGGGGIVSCGSST